MCERCVVVAGMFEREYGRVSTHQAGGAGGEELFLHVGEDGVAHDGEDEEEEADEAAVCDDVHGVMERRDYKIRRHKPYRAIHHKGITYVNRT